MTKQKLLRQLTLRNLIVAFLAVVASAGSWYVLREDGRVGSTYATIFQHHPTLLPSDLVPLAALHIQTATAIAQACLTVAIAIACTRTPRTPESPPDPHTKELALAIRLLTTALLALTENHVGDPPLPPRGDIDTTSRVPDTAAKAAIPTAQPPTPPGVQGHRLPSCSAPPQPGDMRTNLLCDLADTSGGAQGCGGSRQEESSSATSG